MYLGRRRSMATAIRSDRSQVWVAQAGCEVGDSGAAKADRPGLAVSAAAFEFPRWLGGVDENLQIRIRSDQFSM
jgi:hypothetical protein